MIKSIPLNKLVQSPRNVRRHSDPAADAELKASIAAHGLLQNLIVRPAAKGKFEVEAGERRRRAMLALADDKILARDHEVTCLVLEDSAETAVETSLAENFHRLAMNPADEAQAFAALVEGGATVEDVARRFGLTVRFVEGRLRLAKLAPIVFKALASGEITLDIAKAFGATSDQDIQARVFEQVSSAYYAPNPDSIRRMVLSGTVRGSDPMLRRLDLAYALNAHMAQGLTSDRGIAVMDSRERNLANQQTFLVTVTRLRDHLTLVVDSADKLGKAVAHNTGEKTSALEVTERLREAAAKGLAASALNREDHSKKPPELTKERTKPFEIGI